MMVESITGHESMTLYLQNPNTYDTIQRRALNSSKAAEPLRNLASGQEVMCPNCGTSYINTCGLPGMSCPGCGLIKNCPS